MINLSNIANIKLALNKVKLHIGQEVKKFEKP